MSACRPCQANGYASECRTCRDERQAERPRVLPSPSPRIVEASRYTGRPRLVDGKPFGSE